ncbi:Cysteine-rich membrane protein 2 [Spironucleus salmonicida]|uniref:Cysteine-rich membrane protein 2 n=1 Tax=Spironucleus salmonicida TaxID=348837 RepID=V6LWC9_9EUKA|nr:Cysteine-rich membrane protein 2 [Spironucleus salmonicida]|eukprot:EST48016.1 Cysteine-rich membrane protein 2 [Spironucleus salmonicida]
MTCSPSYGQYCDSDNNALLCDMKNIIFPCNCGLSVQNCAVCNSIGCRLCLLGYEPQIGKGCLKLADDKFEISGVILGCLLGIVILLITILVTVKISLRKRKSNHIRLV